MNRRLRRALFFGFTCCTVAACHRAEPPAAAQVAPATVTARPPAVSPPSEATPPPGVLRAYAWHCDDGRTLVVRNLWRERAVSVPLHDGSHRLDQVSAASGTRYANAAASIVFWTKGGTATLEQQGARAVRCEERREDSLTEDARLSGADTPRPADTQANFR